jgi:hypothetical protein
MFKSRAGPSIYAQLYEVNMIKLSYYLDGDDVAGVVDVLVVKYFLVLTYLELDCFYRLPTPMI